MGKGRKRRHRKKQSSLPAPSGEEKTLAQSIVPQAPKLLNLDIESMSVAGGHEDSESSSYPEAQPGFSTSMDLTESHISRKFPRCLITEDVQVALGWTQDFVQECVSDLSFGGLFIETDRLFCKEDPVIIRFGGQLAGRFELLGRVRWANPAIASPGRQSGMGIEFMSMSADAKRALRGILDGRAPAIAG